MPARYDARHRRARARLLAQFTEGQPCARCGHAMYSWQPLDADHVATPRVLGDSPPDALSHARCNRAHGGRLGRARDRARRAGMVQAQVQHTRTSRMW